ncbi:DEAD/DEAH box helicase family protein [Desulfovibrio sp.]|uniref:type I restriction endonuclease subunit R n=1 Tax=Desulfovibrio sp. TaxID=885 RepID=UPI0025C17F02|nr:DEAD/DEAH box helicase family protein [Desulfovibrio sp.]
MNSILSEKDYQKFLLERLEQDNGFVVRKTSHYDPRFAMDRELLFRFLHETQPDTMAALRKICKDALEETIVNHINTEATKKRGSLLNVLRGGVEIANHKLELMYTKPATSFNPALSRKHGQNIFSVMEEVWASEKERVDVVVFLNGLAIMAFELKCNHAGQSFEDSIFQFRTQRNPATRLFRFKAGTLVNFAMDLTEVHMTTRLNGEATVFLPFNRGNGEGVNAGAGNPARPDKFSVAYMWEDILKKDTILDLISRFMLVDTEERINEATGKKEVVESLIFPRYHQLDAIRKLLADVRVNGTALNYLIQHSAGSGKTKTIAWLAYRLADLHDADDRPVFDNVVIMTDRVIVDRQLQEAITALRHKSGQIKVLDDRCTSEDLRLALTGNTKIIATTIQKFPYIVDRVKDLKSKRFAVIIDEAHSSTTGTEMGAVTKTLGAGEKGPEADVEDMIRKEIELNGKQPNVSIFAFTATPKATTLQLFGRLNEHGQREAFHLYSMNQAIQEGFILDVLRNYTEYATFYQINKAIQEDPRYKTNAAKRQIARFVELHDTNIAQRVEVIVEHFRTSVMQELGGNAKAMVVTPSRQAAVKYFQAVRDYLGRKGYDDMKALVAFSGKVKLPHDDTEYTEAGLNGFPEARTREMFDQPGNKLLLVANKYQTGFDQAKLCAMYVLKKLKGVNAVQTLSRLNRIKPPYDKKTFVLDFVNSYDEMKGAFAPYFTATLLASSVTPESIYDLEAQIDAYAILDPGDVETANAILYSGKVTAKQRQQLTFFLEKTRKLLEHYDEEKQEECMQLLRGFVRLYEFLLQASCFEDVELHKKYNFIKYLLAFINIRHSGPGFDLTGKIRAANFVQKKVQEHAEPRLVAKPVVKLPTAERFGLTEDKEKRLSEIIDEINSRTGKNYDNDVVVKAMLQIRDILVKSDRLKTSAKTNTQKDFEFSYFDDVDDALIEGLAQNQDFYTLLLENDEIKRQVLGIFSDEIYRSLREAV